MKPLNWCCTTEDAKYMRFRQSENMAKSIFNPNENWMAKKLRESGFKFTRQAIWGKRLFDFWLHEIAVAIEVDGATHNPKYDAYRDEYNFRRSAIVVLRVPNMNELEANKVVSLLPKLGTKTSRKQEIGTSESSKWLVKMPYPPSYLEQYLARKIV